MQNQNRIVFQICTQVCIQDTNSATPLPIMLMEYNLFGKAGFLSPSYLLVMKVFQTSGLPHSSPSSGWTQQPHPVPGFLEHKPGNTKILSTVILDVQMMDHFIIIFIIFCYLNCGVRLLVERTRIPGQGGKEFWTKISFALKPTPYKTLEKKRL